MFLSNNLKTYFSNVIFFFYFRLTGTLYTIALHPYTLKPTVLPYTLTGHPQTKLIPLLQRIPPSNLKLIKASPPSPSLIKLSLLDMFTSQTLVSGLIDRLMYPPYTTVTCQ